MSLEAFIEPNNEVRVDTLSKLNRIHDIAMKLKDPEAFRIYFELYNTFVLTEIRASVKVNTKTGNWDHLHGSYYIGVDAFVVAAKLYEDHPNAEELMNDGQYDSLAKFLYNNFESIPQDALDEIGLTKDVLETGTGSMIKATKHHHQMVKLYLTL